MKKGREEEVRLLDEQFETLWAIVNSPESQLTKEERQDLNEKLDRLRESISKITVMAT
jgi:hypothetical protein